MFRGGEEKRKKGMIPTGFGTWSSPEMLVNRRPEDPRPPGFIPISAVWESLPVASIICLDLYFNTDRSFPLPLWTRVDLISCLLESIKPSDL